MRIEGVATSRVEVGSCRGVITCKSPIEEWIMDELVTC